MKFSDICIISDDVIKLRQFYEKVFQVKAKGDEIHSWLNLDGLMLVIDTSKLLKINDSFFYVYGKPSGNTIIGFNTDDVDREYERLKKLDVDFLNEPTTHPWGARSFQFKDIDGNIINFRTFIDTES